MKFNKVHFKLATMQTPCASIKITSKIAKKWAAKQDLALNHDKKYRTHPLFLKIIF